MKMTINYCACFELMPLSQLKLFYIPQQDQDVLKKKLSIAVKLTPKVSNNCYGSF